MEIQHAFQIINPTRTTRNTSNNQGGYMEYNTTITSFITTNTIIYLHIGGSL